MHLLFSRFKLLNLDRKWSHGGEFLTLRHFIRLRLGFHCKYCFFFRDKNAWTVLNTSFQIFHVVVKSRCHLRHQTFKKSQKYFYSLKSIKEYFLHNDALMSCFISNIKFSEFSKFSEG